MQRAGETVNAPKAFSQHRGYLQTSFAFARKHLDYRCETKRDASLQQKVSWDSIAARSSYFSTVEPDRAMRWTAFVITALALVATLRGGPQPLTFLLYAGTALVLTAGVLMTNRMRRVAYTAIPAKGINILVLEDKQHDEIVGAIEQARAGELAKFSEPNAGMSVRDHLRRLRWLVEENAMTPEEFTRRQRLVLPEDERPLLMPAPVSADDLHFSQRRLGVSIDITLRSDRFTYRRSSLLGGTESFDVPYRNLKAPSAYFHTGQQLELTGIAFAWCAILLMSWAGHVTQENPPGHYVGGTGLRNAIVDFGPALLAVIGASAVIPMLTRLRYAAPYPSVDLLRDKQYEAILSAIEERRLAVQRSLAEPDPLLTYAEQIQILNELRDEEIITEEEHVRAAQRATLVCDHPLLDRPATEKRQQVREHALH